MRFARVVLPVAICASTACDAPAPAPPPASLVPWNRAAGSLLAGACAAAPDGNVGLFLPALLPLLHATADGARGPTRDELAAALGAIEPEPGRARLRWLRGLDDVEFESGFRVWIDAGLEPVPTWRDSLAGWKSIGGASESFDFRRGDLDDLVARANRWASDVVDRDVHVLRREELSPDSRLLLASAARVKWRWREPFDDGATRREPFFRGAGRTDPIDVEMMCRREETLTGELDGVRWIGIACEGGLRLDLGKVGADRGRRDALAARADLAEAVERALAQRQAGRFAVRLPKVRSWCELELRPALEARGAKAAFTSAADFSGIAGRPGELLIASIRHGCGVEWDEEGGESFGVTDVTVALGEEPPGLDVVFDEPFLALLRAPDGSLLLAQWIEDPFDGAGVRKR